MIIKYDYSKKMAEDLIRIDNDSFNEINYDIDELNERMINSLNYEIYIKYVDDIAIGYAGLLEVQNPHYKAVWIDLIAVSPKHRDNKIGKELLREVMAEINKREIRHFTALVRENNISSMMLFKSIGFKQQKGSFALLYMDEE